MGGIGAAGWALTVVALAGGWPSVLVWGLAGVGAGYAAFLGLHPGTAHAGAPVVAAALVVAAELAFWSIDGQAGSSERRLLMRRIFFLAALAVGTAMIGGLLLVISGSLEAGVGLEALGVLGAVVTVGVVAVLSARAGSG